MIDAMETEEPRLVAVPKGAKDVAAKPNPVASRRSPMARRRAIDIVEEAQRQLKQMIGYPVDGVAEFYGTDDGWKLTVTVVELERIPPSTDVMAEYVVGLDTEGDIVDYRRRQRYYRDQVSVPE